MQMAFANLKWLAHVSTWACVYVESDKQSNLSSGKHHKEPSETLELQAAWPTRVEYTSWQQPQDSHEAVAQSSPVTGQTQGPQQYNFDTWTKENKA